ncbi:hypothetical protein [Pseudoxanthomonas mexicana]|uniref:hypothetical protein n=1 Tax=Pseudoxanthomonas mexicana TaxID=128785 RepID=UPI0028ACE49F|nr:hypothetical protein [Pseudoxanthomonas mexicana]
MALRKDRETQGLAMKIGIYTALFASLLTLSGCTTTLKRSHIQVGSHPPEPGFQYFLPKQQFTVTATYRLESCPDANGDQKARARPLIIRQTASAVETSVPDPTQYHSIPLSAMTSRWKTTTLTGSLFENQVLRSVGITADDRTGAVVKSTLAVATSIARVSIGAPANERVASLCHDVTYRALEVVESSRTKLLDPSLDEKARNAVAAAALAAKAELKITRTFLFEPTTTELVKSESLSNEVLKWIATPALLAHTDEEGRQSYEGSIMTSIEVAPVLQADSSVDSKLLDRGVLYREPMPAIVRICAGVCGSDNTRVLATLSTQVAQLGRHVVIPLENRVFQKNNISLAFHQNGRLDTVTYGNESTLERMAGSAAESASVIQGYLATKKTVDEAEEAKIAGAELKAIKDETELMKARADHIEQARRLLELSGDL